MLHWQRWFLASFLLILSSCGSQTRPDLDIAPVSALLVLPMPTATSKPTRTPSPSPSATPTQAIALLPTKKPSPKPTATETPLPEPTATPTPVNWLENTGRTADNLIYLGNPDAPVTLIDYSDFL